MNVHTTPVKYEGDPIVDQLGTDPIPAEPYYSREYFLDEKEAIFRKTWLHIGHICELPEAGSFIVRRIDLLNASILLTRDRQGEIRAFHNVCPHRGTKLVAETDGKGSVFTCRYHAWTFNNDGSLRAAPDADRFYVDVHDCGLKQVSVDVCAGLIFVNMDTDPDEGLHEFLGDMAAKLEALPVAKATQFTEYVYEIDANWKLTYDNFQENYHLRVVHPKTSEGGTGVDNPFGYPTAYGFLGAHRTQTIWLDFNGTPKPVQGFASMKTYEYAMASGFGDVAPNPEYLAVFPNLFMLGSATQPFSQTIIPISETKSRGVIRLYWSDKDDSATKRFAREYTMASVLDVHCEDRAVIEDGQAGLNSGALEHLHMQQHEVLLRHFYHVVDGKVEAWRNAKGEG